MHMTSASADLGFGPLEFRFVVIADTHLNAVDGSSSSPFAVNARANERAQAVFEHVNRWQPAFVVHVGDIVHPVPELASFAPACERFKALSQPSKRRCIWCPVITTWATSRSSGCPRAP